MPFCTAQNPHVPYPLAHFWHTKISLGKYPSPRLAENSKSEAFLLVLLFFGLGAVCDRIPQCFSRLLPRCLSCVRIDIGRGTGLSMTQVLGHRSHWNAGFQHDGRRSMAQPMQVQRRQPMPVDELREPFCMRINMQPLVLGISADVLTRRSSLLGLPGFEDYGQWLRHWDAAPGGCRLWHFDLLLIVANTIRSSLNADAIPLPVDITPAQPHQFPTANPQQISRRDDCPPHQRLGL